MVRTEVTALPARSLPSDVLLRPRVCAPWWRDPSGEGLDPPASPPTPGAHVVVGSAQHVTGAPGATWTVLAAPGGSPEVEDSGHYRDLGAGDMEASLGLEVKGRGTNVGLAARI